MVFNKNAPRIKIVLDVKVSTHLLFEENTLRGDFGTYRIAEQ